MPLGTKVGLGRGDVVLALPHGKGHSSPPLFGPCLLWPRSPISATAELLNYKRRPMTKLCDLKSDFSDDMMAHLVS